ncbi:MepB family protein [Winogradskyella sp. SYSU M77433]|uniref:MepB family protein n=1 Tax=Winogradskyella sp. SYSU M77433 TaxID=3042722 RepID=UPI0024803A31|nr:MepB family protein [Winogradskyella sp. SYSU M77433]MDH7913570.1 MepB family protein [Winogradskyella sp. SYSU M77433]
MTKFETLNRNLIEVKTKIYNKLSLNISELKNEHEGTEYDACQFELNGMKIISRSSKITPKKVGQFVTFWKRNKNGETEPYSENDLFDFYVINAKSGDRFGQFVFPKSELINKGFVTSEKKDGKRGFRVYPVWDKTLNKQAEKTQKWQLNYFYEINKATNLKDVSKLYDKK